MQLNFNYGDIIHAPASRRDGYVSLHMRRPSGRIGAEIQGSAPDCSIGISINHQ
jgi:hypothetical protein